jgi:adenine/guanine phosphoribosyltransferase-like PRPP-binding protein
MNIMNSAIDKVRLTENGIIQGASHTCHVLNHKVRTKIIIKAVCDLRKISDDFDSIACCGTSGLMVVPQVAELLNKNILLIRKKNEKCYSDFAIEGVSPFRYIILDDLICSGNTVRHIQRTISDEHERARCVGLYCYMPEECSYNIDNLKLFEQRYRMSLLNPCQPRV